MPDPGIETPQKITIDTNSKRIRNMSGTPNRLKYVCALPLIKKNFHFIRHEHNAHDRSCSVILPVPASSGKENGKVLNPTH